MNAPIQVPLKSLTDTIIRYRKMGYSPERLSELFHLDYADVCLFLKVRGWL